MDLSDRSIDSPACPHLAPVEDEPLLRCTQLRHISIFCYNRNN